VHETVTQWLQLGFQELGGDGIPVYDEEFHGFSRLSAVWNGKTNLILMIVKKREK